MFLLFRWISRTAFKSEVCKRFFLSCRSKLPILAELDELETTAQLSRCKKKTPFRRGRKRKARIFILDKETEDFLLKFYDSLKTIQKFPIPTFKLEIVMFFPNDLAHKKSRKLSFPRRSFIRSREDLPIFFNHT